MSARLCLLVLLAGCMEQEFHLDNIPPPRGDLKISGRACDPQARAWLSDAWVYTHLYDDDGRVYDTRSDITDSDGFYDLEGLVADRDYEIRVQVGSEVIDAFTVSLGGQDQVLASPACAANVGLDVTVVTGAWDDLSRVVRQLDGADIDVIDGQVGSELVDFLTDPEALAYQDMILFDGGHREEGIFYGDGPIPTVHENLRAWVQGGGVLVTTDWAYDVVASIWPHRIDFFGDDAVPDAAQVGESGRVRADVTSAALEQAVGGPQVDVEYSLPVWPLIVDTDPTTQVLLQGDAPYRVGLEQDVLSGSPLLVSFQDGDGRVIVSTFRAENGPLMADLLWMLATSRSPR